MSLPSQKRKTSLRAHYLISRSSKLLVKIMPSSLIFALCLFAQVVPTLAHRNGHAVAHQIPTPQQKFMGDDFIDIETDSDFFGLTTFANLPYVNCFKPDETEAGRYDIAILGAPFDTVSRTKTIVSILLLEANQFIKSVTGRPGARFGPAGIRRGSQRIAPGDAWNIYTGRLEPHLSLQTYI